MRPHLLLLCAFAHISLAEEPMKKPFKPANYAEYQRFASAFDGAAHTLDSKRFTVLQKAKDVVVLDVRSRALYDRGHVKGALYLGPDVTIEALQALVPSTKTNVLIYCTNSFTPTRMLSLTHVTLPQIAFLGYANVFMLGSTYTEPKERRAPIEFEGEGLY